MQFYQKSIDRMFVDLFLDFLLFSIDLFALLHVRLYRLDYFSFMTTPELSV